MSWFWFAVCFVGLVAVAASAVWWGAVELRWWMWARKMRRDRRRMERFGYFSRT